MLRKTACRAALAYGLAGAMLAGCLAWLPDWRDWQDADGEYILAARQLGRRVADATFPGWDPERQPLLVIKGAVNYLVDFPGPGAPAGRPVPGWTPSDGRGLAVVRLHRPILPVIAAGAHRVAGQPVIIMPGKSALDQVLTGFMEGAGALGGGEAGVIEGLMRVGTGVRLTPDQFLTFILHESFHAYQMPVLERWCDRLPANDDELWRTIYGDADNNRLQDREGQLLLAAVRAPDAAEARMRAQEFLAVRDQRAALWRGRLGPSGATALLQWEQWYEWAEGLARYVEIRAWRELAPDAPAPESTGAAPAASSGAAPAASSGAAAAASSGAAAALTLPSGAEALIDQVGLPVSADSPRERVYRLGAGQALVLDRLQPGWRARAAAGAPLTDLLRQAVRDR